MANIENPAANAAQDPPESSGEPSETSRYAHSLMALVVNDINDLERPHSSSLEESHFELQQGENWLMFTPPVNGNVVLQSIDPVASEQSFICLDVDRQVAAIKDMRTSKGGETSNDNDTLELLLSRRIRRRDRVESYGPNVNHKPSEPPTEFGGYYSDDENEGDDFDTGGVERPKKYHALEPVPRRQMRIMHQGDRLVLRRDHHSQPSALNPAMEGIVLVYRHHRIVQNAVALQKKQALLTTKDSDGGALNGPSPNVANMLNADPNSSGSTTVSTSKAVIVPPGLDFGPNMAQGEQRERSVGDNTDDRSYLTGEVLVQEQGYVSAITGDDDLIAAELRRKREMSSFQNIPAPVNDAQPLKTDAEMGDIPETVVKGADDQMMVASKNGEKIPKDIVQKEISKSTDTAVNDKQVSISQDQEMIEDNPKEEEIPNETTKERKTPNDDTNGGKCQEELVASPDRDAKPSQKEDNAGETAMPRPEDSNAVETLVVEEEVSKEDHSSTTTEDAGDATQAFPLPVAGLSTQRSVDEQVSDDDTTLGESPHADDTIPLNEVDPYDEPTQPILFPSDNGDGKTDSSTDGEAAPENKKIDEKERKPQDDGLSTPARAVHNVEKGTPGSETSRNLLEDLNGLGTQPLSQSGNAFDYGDQDKQSETGEVPQEIRTEEPVSTLRSSDVDIDAVHAVSGGAIMTGPVGSAEGMTSALPQKELPAHMKQTPQTINEDPDHNRIEDKESEPVPESKGDGYDPSNEAACLANPKDSVSDQVSQPPAPSDREADVMETKDSEQAINVDASISPAEDSPVSKAIPLSPEAAGPLPENENAASVLQDAARATESLEDKKRSDIEESEHDPSCKGTRSDGAEQDGQKEESPHEPDLPPGEKFGSPEVEPKEMKRVEDEANALLYLSKGTPAPEGPLLTQPEGNDASPKAETNKTLKEQSQQASPSQFDKSINSGTPDKAQTNASPPSTSQPSTRSSQHISQRGGAEEDSTQTHEKKAESEEPQRGPRKRGRRGRALQNDAQTGKEQKEQTPSEPRKSSRKRSRTTTESGDSTKLTSVEDSGQPKKEPENTSTPLSTGSRQKKKMKGAQRELPSGVSASTPSSSRKRSRVSSTQKPPSKRVKTEKENRSAEFRVITTGVEAKPRHKMMIEKLGGELLENVEDAAQATHVIAGDKVTPLRRTPKLMIGLCVTSNIVHMDWLEQSARARHALDCSDFLLLNDKAAEEKFDFSMRETLKKGDRLRRKNEHVLSGWYVYVCKGVAGNKAPPENEIRLIADAAGGKWLPSLAASKLGDIDTSRILVVTSDPTPKKQTSTRDVAKVLRTGGHAVTTSWLFQCMIRQEMSGLE